MQNVGQVAVCYIIIRKKQLITLSYFLLGRIDRKIEFPLPDQKTKRRIFNIHTNRMTLSEEVDLEEYILSKDDLSGADIKVPKAIISSFFSA